MHILYRVFCDVGTCVSCREYAVFRKEHGFAVNQGGTANKNNYSSLADGIFLPRIFIYKGEKKNEIQRNRLRYIF